MQITPATAAPPPLALYLGARRRSPLSTVLIRDRMLCDRRNDSLLNSGALPTPVPGLTPALMPNAFHPYARVDWWASSRGMPSGAVFAASRRL
jgi:hypothetical protein